MSHPNPTEEAWIGEDCVHLDIDYRDCGPWRSYELSFEGRTIDEALDTASIHEVNQDGGEISTRALRDFGGEVYEEAEKVIREAFKV